MKRRSGSAASSLLRSLLTYTSTERSPERSSPPHTVREQLLASDDRADPAGHRDEQLELADRQRERAPGGEHETLAQPDLELAGVQDLGRTSVLCGIAATMRAASHGMDGGSCKAVI